MLVEDVSSAQLQAKSKGWACAIEPAIATAEGGVSAGVGIATRNHIGMAAFEEGGHNNL